MSFRIVGSTLFLLGIVAWFAGAVLADTALLRGSSTAQAFFIGLIADLQWSGRAIILIIGITLALMSLAELAIWPRGWLWQRVGRSGRVAFAVLWVMVVVAETALMSWGFMLWGVGPYLALFGAAPAWPLWALAAVVGPLAALGPEWLWRNSLRFLLGRTKTH